MSILSLISGGKELVFKATTGKVSFFHSTGTIFKHVDPDFKNLRLDLPSKPTEKKGAKVYQIGVNATLEEIFSDFSTDFSNLVVSWEQMKSFCRDYPSELRANNGATFFLMRNDRGTYFAVLVRVSPDGPSAFVARYGKNVYDVLDRVVVPEWIVS